MRTRELVRSITTEINRIPPDSQRDVKRVYHKSWEMVMLYTDGLMTPTKAGTTYLKLLLNTIKAEQFNQSQNTPIMEDTTMTMSELVLAITAEVNDVRPDWQRIMRLKTLLNAITADQSQNVPDTNRTDSEVGEVQNAPTTNV